jgi:phosphatidate cytidylyltransferase
LRYSREPVTSDSVTETPAEGNPAQPAPARQVGRDLSAAIGVGVGFGAYVVVCLLFFKPGFVLLVAAATWFASRELHQALQKKGIEATLAPILAGCVVIAFGPYARATWLPDTLTMTAALLACLALTVLAALIWRMPRGPAGYIRDASASVLIIAYVPLLASFSLLMLVGAHGSARIVAYILVVTMSDTGGLIAGRTFGRHPLAPKISPKKSWEGLAGSLVLGIAAGIGTAVFGLKVPFWVGIVLGVALVAVGTCGDLVESMIKRDIGIKDMSSYLPGHGGVMDRLDSLLAAAPVAWLIMYVWVPGG